MSFAETLMRVRQAIQEGGYALRLEIQIDKVELLRVQHEIEFARVLIDEQLRPSSIPPRDGFRYLGSLYDVPIYVREN